MSTVGSPTEAAFTEVLQLGIDTDGFAAQMDQVVAIYTAALEKMPNLDKVSGIAFSESINKLEQVVQQLAEGMGEAFGEISTTMTETAEVIENQMGKAAAAVEESQARIVEALERIKQPMRETKESGGAFSDFWEGLTDQFAKSAGSILRGFLIWNSINAIVRGTTAVITAPFKAVAEGFTYLQDVEERASIVKAALLQSVSYSKDWGDNVRIAGEQADRLVQKIDDLAVKLHVKSQAIQTGFTTFLEAGGRNLTNNVDEALQVSGLVTGALQTLNPNIEGRRLMSEMQSLVSGNIKETDRLATSLGLSKQQLIEIVNHAAKYHDLLQELIAKAPGLTDRIAGANARQLDLINTLELYKTRWEALIAGPLFKQFTDILQQILAWVDRNSDSLTQLGKDLGEGLGKAATAAEHFIQSNWQGLAETLKVVAKLAVGIGATIMEMVSDVTTLVQLGSNAKASITRDRENSDISHEFGKKRLELATRKGPVTQAEIDQIDKDEAAAKGRVQDEFNKKFVSPTEILSKGADNVSRIDSYQKRVDAEIDNFSMPKASGKKGDDTAAPEKPTHDRTIHQTNTGKGNPAAIFQKELRDEITQTEDKYQHEANVIQQALTESTMNHQEAAKKLKELNKQELADIDALIAKYEAKVKKSGAKDPQIQSALESMKSQRDAIKKQLDQRDDKDDEAALKEKEEVAKVHHQAMYNLEVQHQKQMQELLKQYGSEGRFSQAQEFDAQTQVLTTAHETEAESLRQEIARTAEGTVAHEQAVNKLIALDDAYTANMQLRTEQRIELIRKEHEAQFQFGIQGQQAQGALQSTINSIADRTGGDREESARQQAALQRSITDQEIQHTAALLAESRALNANSDATRKYTIDLANLQNARLKEFGEAVQKSAASAGTNTGLGQVLARNTANAQIAQTKQELDGFRQALENAKRILQADANNGADTATVARHQANVDALQSQVGAKSDTLSNMQASADELGLSFDKVRESLQDSLLGPDFLSQWKQLSDDMSTATDATSKLSDGFGMAADAISAMTNIGKTITGTINQYENGRRQGGVLGGVGSLLSSGPVSDALSMVPVVGSIVKPLGEAFSFIGDMFVAQAKHIAEQIQKQITAINNAYADGQATIAQTITALQQQRQTAIEQLSGVKGGQAQLNNLLPQLDNEIASLELQANNTKKTLEDTVLQLQSGNTELASWIKSWQDINKQVADYLAAGGDMATANAYLTEQLEAQRKSITDSLVQGDQQAIQDAISLNQLLQQRIDLVRQEQQTEFGIENQNAIEKRTSTGVQVASQLANQRISYNEQLNDLNYQISTAQQKVDLEKQVFTIASDTATLQAQSNQATLFSLGEQLAIYQEMQNILQNTNGLTFIGTSFAPVVPGTSINGASAISGTPAPITLTVNVDATGQDVNSTQFANYLAAAIQAQVTANRTTP